MWIQVTCTNPQEELKTNNRVNRALVFHRKNHERKCTALIKGSYVMTAHDNANVLGYKVTEIIRGGCVAFMSGLYSGEPGSDLEVVTLELWRV